MQGSKTEKLRREGSILQTGANSKIPPILRFLSTSCAQNFAVKDTQPPCTARHNRDLFYSKGHLLVISQTSVSILLNLTHRSRTMNYGQRGRELLLDLKRSDWLPPYSDEGVRATLQEISLHFDELSDQVDAANSAAARASGGGKGGAGSIPMESRPAMILHDAAIRRNKRCLLAYHAYRMDKLRALRWETSAALPPHVRSLLSEAEVDFFTEYDRLVSRHCTAIDLDLNSDLTPPEEDLVQVRVVRSGLGRIATEYGGSVELDLGTTHFLPRGDVEHLIRQGALQQLDGEEHA